MREDLKALIEWVTERLANCERIAATKQGADLTGWLDDADNFRAILAALRPAARGDAEALYPNGCDCAIKSREPLHHSPECPYRTTDERALLLAVARAANGVVIGAALLSVMEEYSCLDRDRMALLRLRDTLTAFKAAHPAALTPPPPASGPEVR